MKKNRILGVILARGGSKGVPQKNIKDLCGHPLISYSIYAGLKSKYLTRLIVSTDSKKISNIAKNYGAEVPFKRPDALSDDFVGTREVVEHCIHTLRIEGQEYSEVCCLYATAPFVLSSECNLQQIF